MTDDQSEAIQVQSIAFAGEPADPIQAATELRLIPGIVDAEVHLAGDRRVRAIEVFARTRDIDAAAWELVDRASCRFPVGVVSFLAEIPIVVNADLLTQDQTLELVSVATSVVNAIGDNSPEAYWDQAVSRAEMFRPEVRDLMRVHHGLKADGTSDKAEDRRLFCSHWRELSPTPAWEAVDVLSSFGRVYTLVAPIDDVEHTLSDASLELLSAISVDPGFRQWHRALRPRRSIQLELDQTSRVLIAEFVLFVRHTERFGHEWAPYLLRCWWDTESGAWHPSHLYCASERLRLGFLF